MNDIETFIANRAIIGKAVEINKEETQKLLNALLYLDKKVKQLEEQLTWKPIDDYARSGEPVIIAYMDCSTISYAVCDYIDDIDGYLSFCTCIDRAEVFEDKILGYMPIPEFEEK